jgi:hypothetical protein
MKRKKSVLFVALFLCLALIAVGYWFYDKPRTIAGTSEAAVSVSAKDLYSAFINNEELAGSKFIDQVIEVSGLVKEIQHQSQSTTVLLEGDKVGGVLCTLVEGKTDHPTAGTIISVRGRCTGYLTDVYVVDAVLVKN